MYKRFLTVLLILFFGAGATFSGSHADYSEHFKTKSVSLDQQMIKEIQGFDPKVIFKDYTENPTQANYYQGIETEKTDLSQAAAYALANDKAGKTVVEQFGKNQFEVNLNHEAIKQAKLIEEESYAITHGQSNERINCDEKAKICEVKTEEEICTTSRRLPEQTCVKKRVVNVTAEKLHHRADFTVWIDKKWTGYVAVNLITGAMTGTVGGHLTHPIRLTHTCEKITATVHSISNNADPAYWVSVVGLPSCQNNGTITLSVSKGFNRVYPVQVALTIDANYQVFEANDDWDNECASLETNPLCQHKKTTCTQPLATRIINGLPVTRDCWENTAIYTCSSAFTDECSAQKNKNCFQTSSRCLHADGNGCVRYEQKYQCKKKICKLPIVCTQNVFCADGSCVEEKPTQNHDFGKSVASLAVVSESGKSFNQTPESFFSGRAVQCKINPITDFIDCCSDKGWGKKLNLAHCSEAEKALGKAKENYLAHYIGEYCEDKIFGTCLEKKRSYCVFDSKMARLLQEGRLQQLDSQVFGTPEEPQCNGFSIETLQALDFEKIDFVNPIYPFPEGDANQNAGIAGDFTLNAPDATTILMAATNRIKERLEASR